MTLGQFHNLSASVSSSAEVENSNAGLITCSSPGLACREPHRLVFILSNSAWCCPTLMWSCVVRQSSPSLGHVTPPSPLSFIAVFLQFIIDTSCTPTFFLKKQENNERMVEGPKNPAPSVPDYRDARIFPFLLTENI